MPKAVGFRLLIKPDPVIEETKSGIVVVVDKRLEAGATITGTVLHIGPEAFRSFNKAAGVENAPWVNIGDRIYYAKYAGKGIKTESGEELLFLNDEDVVGLV